MVPGNNWKLMYESLLRWYGDIECMAVDSMVKINGGISEGTWSRDRLC